MYRSRAVARVLDVWRPMMETPGYNAPNQTVLKVWKIDTDGKSANRLITVVGFPERPSTFGLLEDNEWILLRRTDHLAYSRIQGCGHVFLDERIQKDIPILVMTSARNHIENVWQVWYTSKGELKPLFYHLVKTVYWCSAVRFFHFSSSTKVRQFVVARLLYGQRYLKDWWLNAPQWCPRAIQRKWVMSVF